MFRPVDPKQSIPKIEEEILKFWQKNKIFEKSLEKNSEDKQYVFYDGPPFATGLPHYGHILGSVIKDVIPRYWTMKGYYVRRRWGWDCHGMPIENIVEKELKISGKKQIEELGVDKFNNACRSKVLTYTKDWKKMVDRIGRWVEFDNAYKTMDPTYMESVWWTLKSIWDKDLIYEGRKVLMYCPRCETPVSKAEIAMDNSYKDINEETVVAKFKIKDPEKSGLPKSTYILAWTTTPWTLPGNVALAIGKNIDYVLVESENENLILAKDRLMDVLKSRKYEIKKELKNADIIGLEYDPLFKIDAIKKTGKKAWYVTDADFVTTEEGTGIVHTAVVYGEDDYNLGLKIDLPVVPLLDSKGIFNQDSPELIRGQYFKKAEKIIKDDLENRNLLFSKENFTHSYPHCWRCDTQLYYNAISAWFINIQKNKDRLIELNEKINWYPEYLKEGRFLNILKTAPDWNISRNRYWATPLPFWKCDEDKCNSTVCIGSIKELKEKATNFGEVYKTDNVEKIDLHKDQMDKIKLKCGKCNGTMSRIPEVIDCWVESASMPFAEFHYPYENKDVFEKRFPGQFIAEYIAQTRAWFYYMHVVSTLLFDDISFENCVNTGTILNEKGEKLSKSKMNYTDPWVIIDQYGVDALRYYMMTSVVMEADNLFFNDREVREIYNKVINILKNVVVFYKTYDIESIEKNNVDESKNVLDQWILAKLNNLIEDVTTNMDNYNTVKAGRPIGEFIDELSTWWLRRSRDRFKNDYLAENKEALFTLHRVLLELSKLMAPFTPFIAEFVYSSVKGKKESVHLENWPTIDVGNNKTENGKLLENMNIVRSVVEKAHAIRAEKGIKVRQPLQKLKISVRSRSAFGGKNNQFSKELLDIIADEVNVKEVIVDDKIKDEIELDTHITNELRIEGNVREMVRQVQMLRKNNGLIPSDKIVLSYYSPDERIINMFEKYKEMIMNDIHASDIIKNKSDNMTEVKFADKKILFSIKKI